MIGFQQIHVSLRAFDWLMARGQSVRSFLHQAPCVTLTDLIGFRLQVSLWRIWSIHRFGFWRKMLCWIVRVWSQWWAFVALFGPLGQIWTSFGEMILDRTLRLLCCKLNNLIRFMLFRCWKRKALRTNAHQVTEYWLLSFCMFLLRVPSCTRRDRLLVCHMQTRATSYNGGHNHDFKFPVAGAGYVGSSCARHFVSPIKHILPTNFAFEWL